MGSVQGYTKCPKCNFNSLFYDDYYKSGEIYMMCNVCGYVYNNEITNRGQTEEKDYGITWTPKYEKTEEQGGGCYSFMPIEGVGQVGVLSPEEDSGKKFESWVLEEHEKEPLSKATYTFLEDNVWFTKDILTQTTTKITDETFEEY